MLVLPLDAHINSWLVLQPSIRLYHPFIDSQGAAFRFVRALSKQGLYEPETPTNLVLALCRFNQKWARTIRPSRTMMRGI